MKALEWITEEQYAEVVRTRMWRGQPVVIPRRCPECGTPIGQNNKPHNRRPDRTDMRCTNCVEVPMMAARLEAECREWRIQKLTAKLVRKGRRHLRAANRRNRTRRSRSKS